MEERIEYKISFPKENEHKSFKISDEEGSYRGSVYVSNDSIYINLINLKLSPSNEKRRFKEIQY